MCLTIHILVALAAMKETPTQMLPPPPPRAYAHALSWSGFVLLEGSAGCPTTPASALTALGCAGLRGQG